MTEFTIKDLCEQAGLQFFPVLQCPSCGHKASVDAWRAIEDVTCCGDGCCQCDVAECPNCEDFFYHYGVRDSLLNSVLIAPDFDTPPVSWEERARLRVKAKAAEIKRINDERLAEEEAYRNDRHQQDAAYAKALQDLSLDDLHHELGVKTVKQIAISGSIDGSLIGCRRRTEAKAAQEHVLNEFRRRKLLFR
jgi:hypothetical protein